RQFDWSKRVSCHWGIAVAIADRQRSTVYGFGNASTLSGNKSSAAATERSATGTSEAVNGAPGATGSCYCCRAICDANSKTHSGSRTISRVTASPIRVPGSEREDADLRSDYEPRRLFRECAGNPAWSLSEVSFGRDWLSMVRLCRAKEGLDQHRHYSCCFCS